MTVPELKRRGYPDHMSLGSLAGSGTLGILIPPSIIMVVYAVAAEVSIIQIFLAGFLLLWVSLIIMGTFLRGPNWSFFGPFEYWDPHKLEPMVNVDLSVLFWVKLLDMPRPENPLIREAPGIILLLGYFVMIPPLLGKTILRKMVAEMGAIRFNVLMHLFLWTAIVPIKMILRWTMSLKYFIGIPEWFFNV